MQSDKEYPTNKTAKKSITKSDLHPAFTKPIVRLKVTIAFIALRIAGILLFFVDIVRHYCMRRMRKAT
jgi:hypothetical protein